MRSALTGSGRRTSISAVLGVLGAAHFVAVGLLMAGIPILTTLASLWMVLSAGFVWIRGGAKIVGPFALRFVMLGLFALAYSAQMLHHHFFDAFEALRFTLAVVGAYAFGRIAVAVDRSSPTSRTARLVAVSLGATLLSVTMVYGTDLSSLERAAGVAGGMWLDSEVVVGTVVGAQSVLAFGFVPLLLGAPAKLGLGRWGSVLRVVGIGAVIWGVWINAALQNRAPFIILGLLASVSLLRMFQHGRARLAAGFRRVLAGGFLAAAAWAVGMWEATGGDRLVERFERERLESGRFDAWSQMLSNLFADFTGGRTTNLGDLVYVHNVWLDVAYDAGFIPMALLVGFHVLHIRGASRVMSSAVDAYGELLWGTALVFFAVCWVEPVIQLSVPYFAGSCLVLGMLGSADRGTSSARTHAMAFGRVASKQHGQTPAQTGPSVPRRGSYAE